MIRKYFNSRAGRLAVVLCFAATVAGVSSGCKKDTLKSKYAGLLQHKWTLKSNSYRDIVLNSYTGSWNTTQVSPGIYREFKSDGSFTFSSPGSSFTGTYQLLSDSILLTLNPATSSSAYAAPDTSFIRKINENLYVSYYRKFFISPNYSTEEEKIDSLVR